MCTYSISLPKSREASSSIHKKNTNTERDVVNLVKKCRFQTMSEFVNDADRPFVNKDTTK